MKRPCFDCDTSSVELQRSKGMSAVWQHDYGTTAAKRLYSKYDTNSVRLQLCDNGTTAVRQHDHGTTAIRLHYEYDTNSVRLQSVHCMTSVRLNAKARLPVMHDCDTTALRVRLTGTTAIWQHDHGTIVRPRYDCISIVWHKFGTITMRQWHDCGRTAIRLWHAYDRIVNRLVYDWNTIMAPLGTTTARLKNDFRTIAWDFDMTTEWLGYDCNST